MKHCSLLLAVALALSLPCAFSWEATGSLSDSYPEFEHLPWSAEPELLHRWDSLRFRVGDSAEEDVLIQPNTLQIIDQIRITDSGLFLLTIQREDGSVPATLSVIGTDEQGSYLAPFPSLAENQYGSEDSLNNVVGIEIDFHRNHLWVVDRGAPERNVGAKVVVYDLERKEIVRKRALPVGSAAGGQGVSSLGSIVLDLSEDDAGHRHHVYIADGTPSAPAILVYDVKNDRIRRVLERHQSTVPVLENMQYGVYYRDFSLVHHRVEDRTLKGVHSLALSCDFATLYYAPLTGRHVYAVSTSLLRNFDASLEEIEEDSWSLGSTLNLFITSMIMGDSGAGHLYLGMGEICSVYAIHTYLLDREHPLYGYRTGLDFVTFANSVWVSSVAFHQQHLYYTTSFLPFVQRGDYPTDRNDGTPIFGVWKHSIPVHEQSSLRGCRSNLV